MKPRLANPAFADRGTRLCLAGVGFSDRLVPRAASAFPAATTSQAAAPAAPSDTSQGGAAFLTETCPVAPTHGQDSAPAVAPAAGALIHSTNAILLTDHMMVLIRAIAAYERCGNERAVELALIEYAKLIGAGALARAVADLSDDLTDVPDFRRTADNRFRG